MFNRGGFNRLKFNTTGGIGAGLSGEMDIAFGMTGGLLVGKGFSGVFDISADMSGAIEKSVNFSGNMDIETDTASGQMENVKGFGGDMDMALGMTSTGLNIFEADILNFQGLVLAPGDVLEINTDTMKALLNGVNVNRYISDDSEFFKLNPGENIVVFESGAVANNAEVRILWRNLYY